MKKGQELNKGKDREKKYRAVKCFWRVFINREQIGTDAWVEFDWDKIL